MYTEEDLRATLSALEDEAPDVAGVMARFERGRRRRRALGVIAAAMTAAAVVAAGVVAVPQLMDRTVDTGANPHYERWRFPFAVDKVPGYEAIYWTKASAAFVQTGLDAEQRVTAGWYLLTIFPKGDFDPTIAAAGEPVEVRGKHGFYHSDLTCNCNSGAGFPGVVWEYAPDSWALAEYYYPRTLGVAALPVDIREMSLRVAGAVRFDRTSTFRVPFRVDDLPTGLQVVDRSWGQLVLLDASGFGTTVALSGPAGELTIATAPVTRPMDGPVATTDPKTGRSIVSDTVGQLDVRLSGVGFSADELEKIVRSITPAANLYDPDTWFDADKAIPLH